MRSVGTRSGKTRAMAGAGVLGAVLALAGCADVAYEATPVADGDAMSVIGVIDGETIKVRVGDDIDTVRLIGIDAPEIIKDECFAEQSARQLRTLVNGGAARFEVDSIQMNRDQQHRLLRHVMTGDGRNVAQTLIAGGFARQHVGDIAYDGQAVFAVAQQQAEQTATGIWSPACAQSAAPPPDAAAAAGPVNPAAAPASPGAPAQPPVGEPSPGDVAAQDPAALDPVPQDPSALAPPANDPLAPDPAANDPLAQDPAAAGLDQAPLDAGPPAADRPTQDSTAPKLMPGCLKIKGNISQDTGEKIYHLPGGEFYDKTQVNESKDERWFCTEAEAVAEGWRKSKR